MRKKIFTFFTGLFLIGAINAAETVIFDPASPGSLADSIVQIGGKPYLKVQVNGWNTTLTLPAVVTIPADVTHVTFEAKVDPNGCGFTNDQLNLFIKVTNSDWSKDFNGGKTSTADFSSYKLGAAGGFDAAILQFACQETSGWNAVVGAVIYIGKISVIKEEMQVAEPPVTITIPKVAAIEIDGIEDDSFANLSENKIDKVAQGTVADENDNSGYFKAAWDETNLYLLVDITDNDPTSYGNATKSWENDGIEMFVDAKDRRYVGGARISAEQHQLRINYDRMDENNEMVADQDGLGDHKMTIAQLAGGTGFTFEIAIPWAGIFNGCYDDPVAAAAENVKAGYQMAFEISILDADQVDHRKSILNWANNTGEDKAYTTNQYYGRIILGEGVGVKNISEKISNIYYSSASQLVKFYNPAKEVAVYDITGKVVLKARNVNQLNVSTLRSGMYMIVADNESVKIVK